MKSVFVLLFFRAFVLSFFCAIYAGLTYGKKAPAPKIKFDKTEFDFGEVNQNEKVTHVFKFKNVGDDTLVIDKVQAP